MYRKCCKMSIVRQMLQILLPRAHRFAIFARRAPSIPSRERSRARRFRAAPGRKASPSISRDCRSESRSRPAPGALTRGSSSSFRVSPSPAIPRPARATSREMSSSRRRAAATTARWGPACPGPDSRLISITSSLTPRRLSASGAAACGTRGQNEQH